MADNVSLKQFVEMAILDRSKVISVATTTEAVVCWIGNSQKKIIFNFNLTPLISVYRLLCHYISCFLWI